MMFKILLYIILVKHKAAFVYNAVITRQVPTDTFTPLTYCAQECIKRNGVCRLLQGTCCQECTCDRSKTFFEVNGYQKCIKNVGYEEKCYYHLRGSQNRGDRTAGLTIKKSGFKKLGIVTTSKVLRSNLSQCSLKPGESKYWDVFSSWQPLFINGRKETNFFFGRKLQAGISYVTLNLKGASAAQYKGLLVKLKLRCTEKKAAIEIVRDSCIVFKLLGTKSYMIPKSPQSSIAPGTETKVTHSNGPTEHITPKRRQPIAGAIKKATESTAKCNMTTEIKTIETTRGTSKPHEVPSVGSTIVMILSVFNTVLAGSFLVKAIARIASPSGRIVSNHEMHEILSIVLGTFLSISINVLLVFIYLWRRGKRKAKQQRLMRQAQYQNQALNRQQVGLQQNEDALTLQEYPNQQPVEEQINVNPDNNDCDSGNNILNNGKPVEELDNLGYKDSTDNLNQPQPHTGKGLVVQIPSEEQGETSLIKFSPMHNTKENLDPYHVGDTPPSLNDVERMMELEELDQVEFQMGNLEMEMEIDENAP